MQDSTEAARWWNVARQQLDLAAEHLPVVRVDGDALLQSPDTAGAELAQFLGSEGTEPRTPERPARAILGGPADPFPPGHEDKYREVLAEAFAALDAEHVSPGRAAAACQARPNRSYATRCVTLERH